MNQKNKLSREAILKTLRQALEPQKNILAMWEGGAAAFGRTDRWSDIDLMVAAKDGQAARAAQEVEAILKKLSPLTAKLSASHPNWPDMIHTFYKLALADEFLLVDVGVMPKSSQDKLLETEIHGKALVHFDKAGVCVSPRLDRKKFLAGMKERKARLINMFELFSNYVAKELNRKNYIEAQYNYFMTLNMLVEALRMKHGPFHYDFRGRYLHYELPPREAAKLQTLFYTKDPADLGRKDARARRWFTEVIKTVK
jgi:predicted nucleotidyltransferase